MKFSEVVAKVRTEAGVSKEVASKAIDALVEAIVTDAANGGKTTIPGLGVFKQTTRPARLARNPRSGETIEVPARSVLTFKASKAKT